MANMTRRSFVTVASVGVLSASTLLLGCSTTDEQPRVELSDTQGVETQEPVQEEATRMEEPMETGKTLIAVYSITGNTAKMARRLQELAPEADLFEIVPQEAYPNDYQATADRALLERDEDRVVPYIGDVENWDAYDTVYLGYPIWWYQLPQCVKKFITDHDWAGKTIYPFNTHEGSGNGGMPRVVAQLAEGATVGSDLAIRGESVESSLGRVDEWFAAIQDE